MRGFKLSIPLIGITRFFSINSCKSIGKVSSNLGPLFFGASLFIGIGVAEAKNTNIRPEAVIDATPTAIQEATKNLKSPDSVYQPEKLPNGTITIVPRPGRASKLMLRLEQQSDGNLVLIEGDHIIKKIILKPGLLKPFPKRLGDLK